MWPLHVLYHRPIKAANKSSRREGFIDRGS